MYKFLNDFTNDNFSMSFPKIAFQKDIYQFLKEKIRTKDIFNNFQMLQNLCIKEYFSMIFLNVYSKKMDRMVFFVCFFLFFGESKFFSFIQQVFNVESDVSCKTKFIGC